MNYQQIIAALIALLPLYGIYEIGKLLSKKLWLRKRGLTTKATIINFQTMKDGNDISYYPIVRFTTIEAEEFEVVVKDYKLSVQPKVGKEICILYNTASPQQLTIDNKWMMCVDVLGILIQFYMLIGFIYFAINGTWLH